MHKHFPYIIFISIIFCQQYQISEIYDDAAH